MSIKLVFAGHFGSGKTSIAQGLHQLGNGRKLEHKEVTSTVGASYYTLPIVSSLDGKMIAKLGIWDTAGQERFNAINQLYYRGAEYCVLVFDVSSRLSFDKLSNWYQSCADVNYASKTHYILVVNKIDTERIIEEDEIKDFCKKNDIDHCIETSATLGIGIEELYKYIVQNIEAFFEPIDFDEIGTKGAVPTCSC